MKELTNDTRESVWTQVTSETSIERKVLPHHLFRPLAEPWPLRHHLASLPAVKLTDVPGPRTVPALGPGTQHSGNTPAHGGHVLEEGVNDE